MTWSRIVLAGVVGTVLGAVVYLGVVQSTVVPPPEAGAHGYVNRFSPPTTAFEVLLIHADGQAYVGLAHDPTMTEPGQFVLGKDPAAFFARRPLLVYAGWLLGAGRPSLFPWSFPVVGALSSGLIAAATVALLQVRRQGQNDLAGIAAAVLPGTIVSLYWIGPDALATALAIAGLAAWLRRPRAMWPAVVLFSLAGLARESALLIPLVVIAHTVWRQRAWRTITPLLVPFAVELVWVLVVFARFGSFGTETARTASFTVPFSGLIDGVLVWTSFDVAVAAVSVGLVAFALVRSRGDLLGWIMAAYVVFGLVLARAVWESWEGFTRVLLPVYVLALVVLLPGTRPPSRVRSAH